MEELIWSGPGEWRAYIVYISLGSRTVRLGSLQGLYERFPDWKLNQVAPATQAGLYREGPFYVVYFLYGTNHLHPSQLRKTKLWPWDEKNICFCKHTIRVHVRSQEQSIEYTSGREGRYCICYAMKCLPRRPKRFCISKNAVVGFKRNICLNWYMVYVTYKR